MKADKHFVITVGILILAVCSGPVVGHSWSNPGDSGSIRFSLGLFAPRADSSYFDEKFEVWTGDADDFQDIAWNIDGTWMYSPTMGLQFGTSWYRGSSTQSYREWTDANGYPITHTTQLETWDFTAAWIFKPGSGNTVRPYFGLGGGLTSWRLWETGDFIDFGATGPPPIVTAGYGDSGTTFMGLVFVGIEFYTRGPWSFFFEGRWKQADTSLGGDFAYLSQSLDLSGGELAAGAAFNF